MFRSALIVTATAVLVAATSQAGTLRVGVPQIEDDRVVLPVVLEGDTGGGVAALDFTLNYDPAVFTPVGAEASEAAQAARKQVESNEVSPGNYVVMMFGMNQTTVTSGEVASITLTKKSQPGTNQSEVSIDGTTFASIEGHEIESTGSSQTVTFPPPPTDDGGGENPPPGDGEPSPPPPATETPVPAPAPPASTPDTPAPATPSVPVGTPRGPSQPATDTPRATPMVVATASREPGQTKVTSVDGVARLNRAAQRLENTRAALGSSARIANRVTTDEGVADTDEAADSQMEPTGANQAPPQRTDARTLVAAAPATEMGEIASSGAPSAPRTKEAADASGIPESSRRLLIVVGTVVAVLLIVFRFARRSAQ